jgi:hypothetical protein
MRCTAALLSRTYVFAAFDGRWPGITFLILALSGKLALGPIAPGTGGRRSKDEDRRLYSQMKEILGEAQKDPNVLAE